jgi:hypothetical protein
MTFDHVFAQGAGLSVLDPVFQWILKHTFQYLSTG